MVSIIITTVMQQPVVDYCPGPSNFLMKVKTNCVAYLYTFHHHPAVIK